jgi:hypothetical protein
MRPVLRTLLVTAIALLALPALATAAPTATRGIVVQRDARGGTVVLARSGHGLRRVRIVSHKRLAMGTLVRIHGSRVSVFGSTGTAVVQGVAAAGPAAEIQGTVLAQSATSLTLSVDGFPAGLAIALGTQTIPTLAVGTPVEVHVSLGPDPANANGIVLTLVSLHVEQGDNGHGSGANASDVRAEGAVTALTEAGPAGGATGSITVAGEHGTVTFVIPAGFGATGVVVGDRVEARGTAAATAGAAPTLVRLEGGKNHGDSGDDDNGGDDDGGNGGNGGGSGSFGSGGGSGSGSGGSSGNN